MKIFYLKKEVEIGDQVTINGVNITVTEQVIKDNPDIFEVIEDKTPEYVECIYAESSFEEPTRFVEGEVLKVYGVDNGGQVKLYKDGYYDWYPLDGLLWKFKPSTKEAYDRQELLKEAKKRYPVGTKFKSIYSDEIITVKTNTYRVFEDNDVIVDYFNFIYNGGKWAKRYLFTSEDGVEIFEGDKYWFTDDKVIVRGSQKTVEGWKINEGDSLKRFSTEKTAQAYLDSLKEKALEDYEDILLKDSKVIREWGNKNERIIFHYGNFYNMLKEHEPKFYWTKVLQLIADDLNGGWTSDWHDGKSKHVIFYAIRNGYRTMDVRDGSSGEVVFKDKDSAKKAIEIMGNKLDYIYK